MDASSPIHLIFFSWSWFLNITSQWDSLHTLFESTLTEEDDTKVKIEIFQLQVKW